MNEPQKARMVEWFDDHWYIITMDNGQRVPIASVTTKLSASPKPFLSRWRGDIGNREADRRMNDAAERGSRIHYAWYVLTGGGVVLYNPAIHPIYSMEDISIIEQQNNGKVFVLQYQDEMYAVYKLKQWLDIVRPRILEREKIVYSLSMNAAGTMDNLIEIDGGSYLINGKTPLALPGGIYVLDLKTGNSIDEDDAPAQAAAYARMETEMSGRQITGTLIVHTSAKTKNGIPGLATLYRNETEMAEDLDYYTAVAAVWERKLKKEKPVMFEFPSLIKL
jgi:hypothetical protein